MGRRSFSCLPAAAAVCCCCLALLVARPVHGGRSGLLLGGAAGGSRVSHHRLLPAARPRLHVTEEEEHEPRGVTAKTKARSSSAPEAGRLRTELRSVPGGPDPMHHHGGSPRRPEQERASP